MNEFERIARLRERFERRASSPRVLLGIGDDAAVVDTSGPAVLSTDACIEGVHFRRGFAPLDVIAQRAMHAAASDLAAMSAEPVAALVALGLPRGFDDIAFDALLEGLARASEELQMPIVGGNLSMAGEIGITTTVVGHEVGRRLTRGGARPGHGIFVSGPVGGAALGLAALLEHRGGPDDPFVRAWREPRARFDIARRIRTVATSAIDLSDGLTADLGHLLEASGVGATLEFASIPTLPGFGQRCVVESRSCEALILGGGEDYELLFTAPDGVIAPAGTTRIGVIDAAGGMRLVRNGERRTLVPAGHRHA